MREFLEHAIFQLVSFWRWLVYYVTLPFRLAIEFLSEFWWRLRDAFEQPGQFLGWILFMPARAFANVFGAIVFVVRLIPWQDRGWYLLEGLPALVVGGGIVCLTAAMLLRPEERMRATYRNAAAHAVGEEDYEAARIYYERLMENLDREYLDNRYQFALTLEKLNDHAGAFALMTSLADQGHAEAGVWYARRRLKDPNLNIKERREALSTLHKALLRNREAIEVERELAEYYIRSSDWKNAETLLLHMVKFDPYANFGLANCARVAEKPEREREYLESALATYRVRLEADPNDNEARERCAEAAFKLQRFSEATSILEAGIHIDPQYARFPSMLARLNLHIYDVSLQEPNKNRVDPAQRARLLMTVLDWIDRAEKAGDDVDSIDFLRGTVYMKQENWSRAAPILERIAAKRPDANIYLAEAYQKLGKESDSQKLYERVFEDYRIKIAMQPFNYTLRLEYATDLEKAGKLQMAEQTLKQGRDYLQHDPPALQRIDQRLAKIYLKLSDEAADAPKPDSEARIRYLQEALKLDPGNREISQRVVTMSMGAGADARDAQRLMRALQEDGASLAFVHFILGNQALTHDDYETARREFEIAYRLDDKMVEVANNLAWVLSNGPNPDLLKALGIVNAALDRAPALSTNAAIRDTRGRIYAKMGRWSDAVTDLEIAREHSPRDPSILRTLADVYMHVGDFSLAEKFEKMADEVDPLPEDPNAPKKPRRSAEEVAALERETYSREVEIAFQDVKRTQDRLARMLREAGDKLGDLEHETNRLRSLQDDLERIQEEIAKRSLKAKPVRPAGPTPLKPTAADPN